MAWQKLTLAIPKDLDPAQRAQLADLITEHIVDRTQRGIDKNGNAFPKYSKEYIKSLDFKNAGKSAGRVDLQLSGDMLAALGLISSRNGQIIIGFQNGSRENDIAEGNILGSYGRSPNSSKARDFLGIDQIKLRELIDNVKLTSANQDQTDNSED